MQKKQEKIFLKRYYSEQLKIYNKDPQRLENLNQTGASQIKLNPEAAALADCCLVLFNLSETITRK